MGAEAPIPDRPVLCPVLVGRAHALRSLDAALERAASGSGLTLVLSGPAGIGKSRLAAEAQRVAVGRGYSVFFGQCFEEDVSFPYAPLYDLFRQEIMSDSGVDQGVSLLAALPGRRPAQEPDSPQAASLDADEESQRLFFTLTAGLIARSAVFPILLVVEDVHWSDEATRRFLLYLARRISSARILVLLTQRTDEHAPGLDHFLAALERERRALILAVKPLDRSAVAAMVQAIFALDRAPQAGLVDALDALTEGNPLFVEEMLRSLLAAGAISPDGITWRGCSVEEAQVPRTIEDLVHSRLARLTDAARDTLLLASVVGRRFDFALLQELTGRDERALLSELKELIAAQFILEEPGDCFAFRHALIRQACYSYLLGRERRILHGKVAAVLRRRVEQGADLPLAELAHHFLAAWAWEEALIYAEQAGQQALSAQAGRAAVEHFTHALQAAQASGVSPAVALHRGRGLAYEMLGQFELARHDQETALRAACDAGNARAEWQALLDLGFLWSGRDLAQAGSYLRQALELARRLHVPELLAHSLNRLGNWCFNSGAEMDAQDCHLEALAIFESLGHRADVAATLDLLGLVMSHTGRTAEGLDYLERAIQEFDALGDRRGLCSALAMSVQMRVDRVEDQALSIERGLAAVELARALVWPAGEAFALSSLAVRYMAGGRLGEAWRAARRALELAEQIEHRMWTVQAHLTLGLIYAQLLVLPPARRHVEQAAALAREMDSEYWIRATSAALAQAALVDGDARGAEAILDRAFGAAPLGRALPDEICRVVRAALAVAQGKPDDALVLLAPVLDSTHRAPGSALYADAPAVEAAALMGLRRYAQAEAVLEAARDAAARAGAQHRLLQINLSLAHCRRADGRPAAAADAIRAARDAVEALAANLPDDPFPELEGASLRAVSLRAVFLQAAARLLSSLRPPTELQAARQAFGGLTGREREVAALIALGLSNREIADRLVISSRTVQTHIGSIFAKLGCDSRAAVAAWAAQHGLPPPSTD